MTFTQHNIKPNLMSRGNDTEQAAMCLNFAVITIVKFTSFLRLQNDMLLNYQKGKLL